MTTQPRKFHLYQLLLIPLFIFLVPIQGEENSDFHSHLTVKSFIDLGHLVNGHNFYSEDGERNLSMLPLNRINAMAIQSVTMGSFNVAVGLSGLIWWPYGGVNTDASQRVQRIKPMVPVARGKWTFGDPKTSGGFLQAGTFAFKYNMDAKNLGEYLYRSGTYPGFLWTNEGWLLMNRAGHYSHGLMFSSTHAGGLFKQNANLLMETNYFPIGDFSPGYDFSVNTKWITVGGGAVLNHYLANRPSKLARKLDQNTYVSAVVEETDSLGVVSYVNYKGQKHNLPFTALDSTVVDLHHWTSKGIKLMGRASLNLGHVLPENVGDPDDLKLFSEVAVLGWENQPLFYEDRSERMPIMFGVNLPTFNILDVLSFQMEHYKSPYNDIELFNVFALPIWETAVTDSVTRDDWKWSFYAKKKFNKLLTVYCQVASDHFRAMNGSFKASSVPLTTSPKHWYYIFRMEFALR